MPLLPPDATADLHKFLATAFNDEGFRLFWRRVFGIYAMDGLGGASHLAVVASAVDALAREGKADEAFFRELERERPAHQREIWLMAARWGVVRAPDPPVERIVHEAWWTGRRFAMAAALLLGVGAIGVTLGRVWVECPHSECPQSECPHSECPRTECPQCDTPTRTPGKGVEQWASDTPDRLETASRFPTPPMPELVDLEHADGDKSDAGLKARLAAKQAMTPGFKERLADIRECFRDWSTFDAFSCPHEPFGYSEVWYDVRITETGEIVEVKFKTHNTLRSTPDLCVRDRWLTHVVQAPQISAGTWTLRIKIPAPMVPIAGAKNCPPA